MQVDPLLASLLPGFSRECQGLCERAASALMTLEREGQSEEDRTVSWEALARSLHTLKGTSATLGLDAFSALAHQMEGLVGPEKRAEVLSSQLSDALLSGLDFLRRQVDALAAGESLNGSAAALLTERLAALAQGDTWSEVPSETPLTEQGRSDRSVSLSTWTISINHISPLLMDAEHLRELRLRMEERRLQVETLIGQLESKDQADPRHVRASLQTIRSAMVRDSEDAEERFSSVEDNIRGLSTLPVRVVLDPLHRAVRDLCQKLNRRARLSVLGADLSLGRWVLEPLAGVVSHLIRNAIDHGIESPDERRTSGKHSEGLLTVRVEQKGNVFSLEVSDDGRGIDVALVARAAVRKGLLPKGTGEDLSAAALEELLFTPGFSTREEVTETSGRGIGLDVVRAEVERLSGSLSVRSRTGQGTTFTLQFPAELGTSPVMLVQVGDAIWGIPHTGLELLLRANPESFHRSQNVPYVETKGALIPVLPLGVVLGVRDHGEIVKGQPLVLTSASGKRVALAVDQILGMRDLSIRPMPPELQHLSPFLGAGVMARGELVLVVRPEWVTAEERQIVPKTRSARRNALVVDDSLTARALHRNMLESGGFNVQLASSAAQAEDFLRKTHYDVLVCDVAMEGMDGIALTQNLRARPEHASLAVVLVSGRQGKDVAQTGLSAGADAYLNKKDCAAGKLLEVVNSALAQRSAS